MAYKQLLYAPVIRSGATNTRLYEEKTSSGRKFLNKRVTKTGCKYFAPLVREELVMRLWSMTVLRKTCVALSSNHE